MDFKFFIKPYLNQEPNFFSLGHLKDFFKVFLYSFLLPVVVFLPFLLLNRETFKVIFHDLKVLQTSQLQNGFYNLVIFGPLMEELIFRF